jgi:hypothetical protein
MQAMLSVTTLRHWMSICGLSRPGAGQGRVRTPLRGSLPGAILTTGRAQGRVRIVLSLALGRSSEWHPEDYHEEESGRAPARLPGRQICKGLIQCLKVVTESMACMRERKQDERFAAGEVTRTRNPCTKLCVLESHCKSYVWCSPRVFLLTQSTICSQEHGLHERA